MPKVGAVWPKTTKDNDGNEKEFLSGKVTIDGLEFWLDLYPNSSNNPKAPAYDAYLKPIQQQSYPTF